MIDPLRARRRCEVLDPSPDSWIWRHPLWFGVLFAIELLLAIVSISVVVHLVLR